MQRHTWAWTLILLSAFPLSVLADDYMENRGHYDPQWFAEILDVELDDDRAYTFGVGGMAIFNIADPDNPSFVGRYEPPGHPWNRFYRGAVGPGEIYAGGRAFSISVIGIADPGNPQLLHNYGDPDMSYEGLALEGDLLVAARHGDGLELIDVTNSSAPVTLSELTTLSDAWDLEIRGDLVYVADGIGGLRVVDISNPLSPFLQSSFPTSGFAKDVDVSGDLAVVACGSSGFDVFDVSDPMNISQVGHGNTSGLAVTLDLDGSLLFVADWDDVEVFDLSVPESPGFAGSEKTPIRAMGLAARDGLAYVTDWNKFRVYDFGPTTLADVHVDIEEMNFFDNTADVPVDSSFVIENTGGSTLNVTEVRSFNSRFEMHEPTAFSIPAGGQHTVTLTYHPTGTDDSTFFAVESDDSDEAQVSFPVYTGNQSGRLDIGEDAPDWAHSDGDGIPYKLSDYLGKVVIMAFFADW